MKISIAISTLILATAAVIGWQIDGWLAASRADQKQFAAEANRLGVFVDDTHATRRIAKRPRIDGEAVARRLAIDYIQLTKESENGGKRDEAWQARSRDCFTRISALDASSLKVLIAALLSSQEFEEKQRTEQLVHLFRTTLARKDPRGALEFVIQHSAALKDAGYDYVISDSLGYWAKDDPLATVEWMKKNAAEFPAAIKSQALHNVFHSAAEKDPRLAFTLMANLGLNDSDSHSALNTIVRAAATDEQRNATLAALRDYREAHKDDKEARQAADQMVGYFSQGFQEDGFEAGSKWLASAKLNSRELDRFCGELARNYPGDEHAQWIEWIGGNLPPGKGDQHIISLIGRWTEQDYEGAGKWLATVPEGPAKNAAIRGYALTIYKHDRETAMQWIMTLPPDERREQTLRFILESKLRDDPEAAAAFAKEHGIK